MDLAGELGELYFSRAISALICQLGNELGSRADRVSLAQNLEVAMGLFSRFCVLVFAVLFGLGLSASAQERRVALVVGNSGYRSVDRLSNPVNDARLIAGILRSEGFTLVGDGPLLDLDKAHFDQAVQAFGRSLRGADVALFYYSGHGMQIEGINWLVPVDANPTGPRDVDFQMVDASLILKQMEGSGTKLNLVVLDACRNNPFAFRGVRGTQTGLAEMRAPEGTVISYATQPGNVAADGRSANSPYTTALANALRRPGLDVFQVFNAVGLQVKTATGGAQQPWFAASPLAGNFYFSNAPVTIQQPADPDIVFWQSIASSRDPADFQAYLRRYPRGMFADLARTRLSAMAAAASAPALGGGVRVLTEEPPPGNLGSGETVFVDDHSCPSGQIKQLVGGGRNMIGGALRGGAHRQRSCVQRSP